MTFGCNTVSLPLRIAAKLGYNELLGDRKNVFVKTGLIFCSNWPIDIEKFVRFVEPRIGGFKSGFLELRVVTLLRVAYPLFLPKSSSMTFYSQDMIFFYRLALSKMAVMIFSKAMPKEKRWPASLQKWAREKQRKSQKSLSRRLVNVVF